LSPSLGYVSVAKVGRGAGVAGASYGGLLDGVLPAITMTGVAVTPQGDGNREKCANPVWTGAPVRYVVRRGNRYMREFNGPYRDGETSEL
jgi:hypothetical protein